MKKALKIIGITLLIIFALLLTIPFAFQSQIKDMIKRYINQNLNAQVEFSDVNLSLLRSFPQAHVSVHDLVITNFKPFEGETLATSKSIAFTMSVKELLKNADEEAIIINSIAIDETLLTLKTDAQGNTNYDIVKAKETSSSNDSTFSLDIEDYRIQNSALSYIDEAANVSVFITELNHQGKGNFSADQSELDTYSEANVSMNVENTNYLSNNKIKLEALIGIDLENSTYTFKENKGFINQLPIEFKGYVKQLEDGQEIDITFENPESSFKDFLAVIPESYSKNIENVETTGDFKVKGKLKGLISETTIPTMDISIVSDNASFKYPDLPKRVENISINTSIKNTTGNADDTFIDINTLNFKIDNDVFKSSATLKQLTQNMLVNANIDGTLNLANISKAYPIKLDTPLTGILKARLNTAFDMNAIETNAYERIKNNGSASITGFNYSSKEMAHPIEISRADITFNPGSVSLNTFEAKTGQSDLNAKGTIRNLIGFLMGKNDLQGNFSVNSNTFVLNDFMTSEGETETTTTTKKEAFKIPQFLDCTIDANAKTVVYDNLNLKDVKGTLAIKDQQASLKGLSSTLFNGILALTGNVSTKTDTPVFDLSIGADGFDIGQSFDKLDLLKSLAPIAKIVQGKLNTTINLSGTLNEEFTPNLNSINGNAIAQILTASVNTDQTKLLNSLGDALNFIDFKKLDLKDLKTHLEFADGKVNVKPFQLQYKDIAIEVSGSHGFDKSLAYNAVFNVPAKYLGSDVNRLIGKINDNEVNKISIPINAKIAGSYTSPQVSTDLTSGVANLTKQLIEIEKQKLLNQGKGKIKDLIGGLTGTKKTTTSTDSTATPTNSIKTDSSATLPKTQIKEGVKDILGGLIKNRKKKDTINQKN
ncbi:AsmA-like protein [Flavobacteriaceae bacterium MAR_2010_105]|nr:AsmA-like protein [Flavobacteriaceae bacterium MAR_2010_105]